MKLENISRWAEIVANLGVIITLLILVAEVRDNTRSLQRESFLSRSSAINAPFLENDRLASILVDIKEVDGWEGSPFEEAFAERYGVPLDDAITWGRYVATLWTGVEADFVVEGASEALRARIELLLGFPDTRMGWELNPQLSNTAFGQYVIQIESGM